MTKTCTCCKESKDLTEFYANPRAKDKKDYRCKACSKVRASKFANTLTPFERRARKLKAAYGMSPQEYEAKYEEQGGRCSICRVEAPAGGGKGLHIDHCHETDKVRGLLCSACNLGLGKFMDSSARLRSALHYLAHWQGQ